MYIQFNQKKVGSGKIYKSVLLCEKYRKNGIPQTRVIANLSKFPDNVILAIKHTIKKTKEQMVAVKDIIVTKSVDYGFVFVLIAIMNKLRISEVLEKIYPTRYSIIKMLIIGKIVTRGSKLAIFNWINRNDHIARKLGIDIEELKLSEIYSTVGDLPNLQEKIEKKWGLYHQTKHTDIFLYDITSTYFEGTQNELAAFGYNRDKKKGKMQITIGLITDSEGFPLKIEVFKGNTNDHTTVISQLKAIKEYYNAETIILVGDRGMKIKYNLALMDASSKEGVDYITGLTHAEIRELLNNGIIQLDMFADELIEIEDEGKRYILSVNPDLEEECRKKRNDLRDKFEQEISEIRGLFMSRKTKNETNIEKLKKGYKNKKLVTCFSAKKLDSYKYNSTVLLKKYKMTSFYEINISNNKFDVIFKIDEYDKAKKLDGKYIIETTVLKDKLNKEEVRGQYKNLKYVENAFRDLKKTRIEVRPVFHINEETTRGHILISMFAYAIIREIETQIFPWLKASNKAKKEQLSFEDIEEELKMIKLNVLNLGINYDEIKITRLNQRQKEIFSILNIKENELEIDR